MKKIISKKNIILVKLEKTIVKSDVFFEILLISIKKNFFLFIIKLFDFFKNKKKWKKKIISNSNLNIKFLPYNFKLITWLSKKKTNSKIILYSNLNQSYTNQIYKHLGIFDEIIFENSFSKSKKFKNKDFDFVCDNTENCSISKNAKSIFQISKSSIKKNFPNNIKVRNICFKEKKSINIFFKILRVHQWIKNFLIFLPLIAIHEFDNIDYLKDLILGFFSFCLCSSSVYIVNDLMDIQHDRENLEKSQRPLANGTFQINYALILIPIISIFSFSLAIYISYNFFLVIIFYFIISSLYTFKIKNMFIFDCVVLTFLYNLRVIAGSAITNISISNWLFFFLSFIFLSLAFLKRYNEILMFNKIKKNLLPGRKYNTFHKSYLFYFGLFFGYSSSIILLFYAKSSKAVELYMHPEFLWYVIPLILLWISHIWYKSYKKKMKYDPVEFVIKDRFSFIIFFLVIIIYLFSSFGVFW